MEVYFYLNLLRVYDKCPWIVSIFSQSVRMITYFPPFLLLKYGKLQFSYFILVTLVFLEYSPCFLVVLKNIFHVCISLNRILIPHVYSLLPSFLSCVVITSFNLNEFMHICIYKFQKFYWGFINTLFKNTFMFTEKLPKITQTVPTYTTSTSPYWYYLTLIYLLLLMNQYWCIIIY